MIRHRRGPIAEESSSSSEDEEDAFTKLAQKNRKKGKGSTFTAATKVVITAQAPLTTPSTPITDSTNSTTVTASSTTTTTTLNGFDKAITATQTINKQQFPAIITAPAVSNVTTMTPQAATTLPIKPPVTSSMKRHHGAMSSARKAKMDALLLELEHNRKTQPIPSQQSSQKGGGSFVQPGEEHITTNLFVGNLAPSITEEQIAELFSQFGDLYSVKIMWARTPEEMARNRHSGFVCFVHRRDAEDALETLDETDPFNVGRRIMVRWGRNVKKDIKPDATVTVHTRKRRRVLGTSSSSMALSPSPSTGSDATPQRAHCVTVVAPVDAKRAHWITTVAQFVAKDGARFERRLLEREANNKQFSFLQRNCSSGSSNGGGGGGGGGTADMQERIYFQWRVFAFLQGDSVFTWRTEPFVMFRGGALWIPPPVDAAAAQLELQQEERKEKQIRRLQEQRRYRSSHRPSAQQHRGPDGGERLSSADIQEFRRLFAQDLSTSRGSICRAMAFCFERSGSSAQVCQLIKELLLENNTDQSPKDAAVEVKIAQLFLLSDILFNSQQPGVRNAFRYRDAIEKMAPEVFTALGSMEWGGRLTRNKLALAVSSVLGAWTNWSVYLPTFLDELHDRFEGRPIVSIPDRSAETSTKETTSDPGKSAEQQALLQQPSTDQNIVNEDRTLEYEQKPKGDWSLVDPSAPERSQVSRTDDEKTTSAEDDGEDADGEPWDEDADADGAPLDNSIENSDSRGKDSDGMPLEENDEDGDVDGVPLEDDADGDPLDDDEPNDNDDDDADGIPLDDDEKTP